MNLDIIVPVFNGDKYIDTFFNSFLVAKKGIENSINLILVDNGSKDDTQRKIQNFCHKNHEIKYYFFDDKIGSYAARNYGLQKSSSEMILFTDIDCEFSPSFFENLFRVSFSTDSFYGGKVEIRVENNKNPWEILDSESHMRNQELLFATANMFVKRAVYEVVGSFSETISGGDHAWSKRAKSKGFKPKYIEDIVVFHPPRKNYEEFQKKYLRIAYGDAINRYNKGNISYIIGFFKFLIKLPLLPKCKKKFGHISLKDYMFFRVCFLKLRINQLFVYLSAPIKGFKNHLYR